MKNILLIISSIICIPLFAQQWKTVYTSTGSGSYIKKIQFVNNTTAYAVGDSALLKSTDGGDTWTDMTANITSTNPSFNTLFFATENIGFIGRSSITGGPTLLKTINGGNSWADVSSSNMTQGVNNLYFTTATNGYATGGVGAGNVFARTTNGGQSWIKVQTPAIQTAVTMHFINDSVGFSGTHQIMKTTDGGKGWLPVNMTALTSANAISDFVFVNSSLGFAYTYNGAVMLKTTDGGDTWTSKFTGAGGAFGYDISFTDANTGFFILNYNKIYLTANGGDSWSVDTLFPVLNSPTCLTALPGRVLVGTLGGNILIRKSSSAGIDNPEAENFSIYPNPVNTGILNFRNPNHQKLSVNIYDTFGRLIISESNIAGKLDVQLAPAVYYCTVQAEGSVNTYTQKLVVQ